MKTEFLYHYYKNKGLPLRNRLFGHIGDLAYLTYPFANLANSLSEHSLFKAVLKRIGISSQHSLPKFAKKKFSSWCREQNVHHPHPDVVLFNDTFNEFFDPEIGQAATAILRACGYKFAIPSWICCGRPLLSKGMLKQALRKAKKLIQKFFPYTKKGIPIVGLEPSCILTIKDDLPALVAKQEPKLFDEAENVARACMTWEEFLLAHKKNGGQLPFDSKTDIDIHIHGHCHQKSLVGMETTLNLLSFIPRVHPHLIPSGCCGVAGSFGYEEEHVEISKKIGELKLLPYVRKLSASTVIIADGTSCRSQIEWNTTKKAHHMTIFLQSLLPNSKL
jgi:Fe-S oxidoreductase